MCQSIVISVKSSRNFLPREIARKGLFDVRPLICDCLRAKPEEQKERKPFWLYNTTFAPPWFCSKIIFDTQGLLLKHSVVVIREIEDSLTHDGKFEHC